MDKYGSLEDVERAIEDGSFSLRLAPPELRTGEFWKMAVELDPDMLKFVPEDMKTEDLCIMAVNLDPWALKHVPEGMKTRALCFKAVKQDGILLKYVPERLRDAGMCWEAAGGGVPDGCLRRSFTRAEAEDIPESVRGEIADRIIASMDALIFPESRRNKAANYMDGMYPAVLMTEKICRHCVSLDGTLLESVPEQFRTPDVCAAAVAEWGGALKDVPEGLRTEELCLEAVAACGWPLMSVPEEMKTDGFLLKAASEGLGRRPAEEDAHEFAASFWDGVPQDSAGHAAEMFRRNGLEIMAECRPEEEEPAGPRL